MENKLLILSCTRQKQPQPALLSAINRYDGPAFRVVRRYLGTQPQPDRRPDVFILSAFFGLIPGDLPIPDYNCLMTGQRATELQLTTLETLNDILSRETYTKMFVSLGAQYAAALAGFEALLSPTTQLHMATGSPGRKLAALHAWLYAKTLPISPSPEITTAKPARLRGVVVDLTAEQVLTAGRNALSGSTAEATNYQVWYVNVDNHRVSPKWLVSRITGLPVSSFVTSEALRLLGQLGVQAQRVNLLCDES